MKYDCIIIGGGVIGTSIAFHLQQQAPEKKILLLEKNTKIAFGNTSKSAALYRNIFSSKTSQVLASSSIAFYESIAGKIGLKKLGYLWMFSKKDWQQSQQGIRKLDTENNFIDIFTPDEIPEHIQINTNAKGEFSEIHRILYGHRCGALSAVNLARYYAQQFEQQGGKIKLNTEIMKINLSEKERNYPPWADVKIISLIDQEGNDYSAENFIFATGAWTNELLSPIGIASQIYPMKREMFILKLNDASQISSDLKTKLPILILPTGGVYVKPLLLNKMIMVGCASELGNPFQMTDYPPVVNEEYFFNVLEPVLTHYFPKLNNYKLFSKWAGYYAYYWPDKNPVIEKVSNIQWVSGTSGSGIMKADAIGRVAAAKCLGLDKADLFDKSKILVNDLSLKKRNVDTEELII
ncbi:MAG: NAD(P)/FAD-dependent oxidoreductase [Candidatus Heimdallarchaeota archaeon]